MDEGRSQSFTLLFAVVMSQEYLSRKRDYCPYCACLYVSAYVLGIRGDTAKRTFFLSRRRGKEQKDKRRENEEMIGKDGSECALVDP